MVTNHDKKRRRSIRTREHAFVRTGTNMQRAFSRTEHARSLAGGGRRSLEEQSEDPLRLLITVLKNSFSSFLSLSALQDLHFQPCILRAAKRRLSLHTWKPLGCGRTTQNRRQLSAARAAGALARGWLFVLGGALAHAHLHKRKERKYKNKDIKMSENMHAAPFWVRQILGEKREDSLRIV